MRRTISALSALLLVGSLAACGSADPKTAPAGSTATATGSGASSTPPAEPVALSGSQLFASMTQAMAAKKTAAVHFESSFGTQTVSGGGAFRFAASDFAADMSVVLPGQGKVRAILLPGAFYLRLPAAAGLQAAKPWLELSAKGGGNDPFSKAFGPLMDQLKQSFDPQSSLGLLKATTTVEPAGTERVGGVETTKYVATVDLAKAAALAKGAVAQQYRTLLDSGVTTLQSSIWVDGQNLPRRFSTVVPSAQGDVTATGTYTDWGKPVTVKAPPRSQIASLPTGAGG